MLDADAVVDEPGELDPEKGAAAAAELHRREREHRLAMNERADRMSVTREWFGSNEPDATPLDRLRTHDGWRTIKEEAFEARISRVEMSYRDGTPTIALVDPAGGRVLAHVSCKPDADPERELFPAARRAIRRLVRAQRRRLRAQPRRFTLRRPSRRTNSRRRARATARAPGASRPSDDDEPHDLAARGRP